MWTSTLELSPRRVLLTRALGRFWRGAYFSSFSPLQVQNVPRQQLPARNWVRVRNRLAGICGSDLHLIYADGDFRVAPAALPTHQRMYPGHEVVGEVIEVGEDVTYVRVGDRVALQYGQNCLTTGTLPVCRSCASGNYNLCEQGKFAGPEPIGGGWSEEMLLQERQVFPVPTSLSDQQAVLLEPTAVAVHVVLRHLPKPDDHVLIMGAGTIGLLVLQVIRALSPQTTISVMARYPFQVEQATRMGAASILYPQDMYNSVVRATGAKMYKGMFGNKMLLGGYDAIYDTIGTQSTVSNALRWTRAGGTTVVAGVDLHFMYIDLTPTWYQEVNLIGSVAHGIESWPIGTRQRRSTFDVAAELIEQGLLHPEKLITHNFALTNFREALTTATNKGETRSVKVVFDYALLPASVVPNVRTSARQNRPVRATTAAWPTQEQPDQEDEAEETAQHEKVNAPGGRTWSQTVQPLPPTPPVSPEPIEYVEPSENAYVESIDLPAPEAAQSDNEGEHFHANEMGSEYIPADSLDTPGEAEQSPYVTDEAGDVINRTGADETADEYIPLDSPLYTTGDIEQTPYVTEDTVTFNIYSEESYNEEPVMADAPWLEQLDRVTSEGEQAQYEPEAIAIGQEAPAQSIQEAEESDPDTMIVRQPGRSRSKSASRKTGNRTDATKDSSDTLQE